MTESDRNNPRQIERGDAIGRVSPSREAAESQLRIRARQQAAVAALGHLALATEDLGVVMRRAVTQLADVMGVELVELLELSPDGTSLAVRESFGWPATSDRAVRQPAKPTSQIGLALAANEPVLSSNLRSEKRFGLPARLRSAGAVSGAVVVVPGTPRTWGALAVYSRRRREFSPDDVHLLRSVANVLAAAVKDQNAAEALRAAEARMRAVVNTLVDAVITIDERGTIDSANPAAERLFGYPAAELIGRNVNVLMPEPYRREHDGYMSAYVRTGTAKIVGIGREVVGRRRDGSVFPMELAVSELWVGGRRMFTGVVRDVTDRRRLEREILDAAAEEQRRIGQDLHDGLCQQLAGLAFSTEVLRRKLQERSDPQTSAVERLAELVDQAITQARGMARGLQPVALEAGGLTAALQELAAKVSDMFQVRCRFEGGSGCRIHDNAAATHLYRIAQEAITNAVRHGRAKSIRISLGCRDGGLALAIADDGAGISQTRGDGRGMGLTAMAYRARMVGGTLDIRPGRRGGTVVSCVVPRGAIGSPAAEPGDKKPSAQVAPDHGQKVPSIRQRAVGAVRAAQDANPRRRRSPDRP
jgi:PAS domain S-box-containing protein